jgi:hypothetical protein
VGRKGWADWGWTYADGDEELEGAVDAGVTLGGPGGSRVLHEEDCVLREFLDEALFLEALEAEVDLVDFCPGDWDDALGGGLLCAALCDCRCGGEESVQRVPASGIVVIRWGSRDAWDGPWRLVSVEILKRPKLSII